LFLTLLFRLSSRVNRACWQLPPAQGGWRLDEQAWVLVDPAGMRVPLTTGERAFMLTLFNAPERRAKHADLIAAIDAGSASASHATSRARLGVLVGRMRQKFTQHGSALPLKSVHRWGYMFAACVNG
jgi:DNA-binding response OmpR family regulator